MGNKGIKSGNTDFGSIIGILIGSVLFFTSFIDVIRYRVWYWYIMVLGAIWLLRGCCNLQRAVAGGILIVVLIVFGVTVSIIYF